MVAKIIAAIMSSISFVIAITPIILPLVKVVVSYIGSKTHNQRIKMLTDRSLIIVRALEQTPLDNDTKYKNAAKQLNEYCNQVGIKIDPSQIRDYIEYSVNLTKAINSSNK